jgi:hypothetical protein
MMSHASREGSKRADPLIAVDDLAGPLRQVRHAYNPCENEMVRSISDDQHHVSKGRSSSGILAQHGEQNFSGQRRSKRNICSVFAIRTLW